MSSAPDPSARPALRRRMTSRDPAEPHRAATPLELLYDLCFVVAIAQAAACLHHSIAEAHAAEGLVGFALVFFAIWWAWMGFAWFASAFDTDDTAYRLKVLVQITGVLVLAAGVPRAFEQSDFGVITLGYVIMRIGLVAQWLRAATQDRDYRKTALRYAGGIVLCQLGWVALLAAPPDKWAIGWLFLMPLELAVPAFAEAARPTRWHPHHIAERYGLLTIIVIGESVLAATLAIQAALDEGESLGSVLPVILGAPLILFFMWWLYFAPTAHRLLRTTRIAFIWGYGHYVIFASAAAVGAALAVAVDQSLGRTHLSDFWAGQALAIPVALYLASVWFLQFRCQGTPRATHAAFALAAAAILLAPFAPWPAFIIGAILAALTAAVVLGGRAADEAAA